MVTVYCDNEDCDNEEELEVVGEDDRQEWKEEYYECHICGSKKIHRIEYDQIGLVTSDKIITLEEED